MSGLRVDFGLLIAVFVSSLISCQSKLDTSSGLFSKHPDPVITGTIGEWDWKNTESPFVFVENDTFYMFYDANKPPDPQGYNIGYAISKDGIGTDIYG